MSESPGCFQIARSLAGNDFAGIPAAEYLGPIVEGDPLDGLGGKETRVNFATAFHEQTRDPVAAKPKSDRFICGD